MRKVCFDQMLRYQDSECIIVGKGLNKLKKKTPIVNNLKTQMPMAFSRIKEFVYKELGDIGFIDFWGEVEIYKINTYY